ncbi:MAG: protein-ADP-ribose hydrolase [Desulfobacteraceae bacterium]
MTSKNALPLEKYASLIDLEAPFDAPGPIPASGKETEVIIDELLAFLMAESNTNDGLGGVQDKRRLLQSLLTIREPNALPDWFHTGMDRLLQWEMRRKEITDASLLPKISTVLPQSAYPAANLCALWRGDVTTLKIDAIVNAANAALLGCFTPFHACIDNVIHAAAGPHLRQDCHVIMQHQGRPEQTGGAKITRAYNLPSRFILHTVGPIFDGKRIGPSANQADQLAACYSACLDLASRISGLASIAFCAVSTGVFGFPKRAAARIALDAVGIWLDRHPGKMERVVFNVFSEADQRVYIDTLTGSVS